MDKYVAIILILIAAFGMLAMLVIVHRERVATRALESPFAASTEGGTRCPKCGMGNLWTENCISCGTRLPA